jgi:hypothetical protein
MREGMGLIFALEEPSGYEYVERKRELVIIATQSRTLVVRSVSQLGWGSDGESRPPRVGVPRRYRQPHARVG